VSGFSRSEKFRKDEWKLIRMNEVEATEINWLWYPYIPFGKIKGATVYTVYYIVLAPLIVRALGSGSHILYHPDIK
jgi:hypothetical protein